jgi:predicted nicotinamide N-methyase
MQQEIKGEKKVIVQEEIEEEDEGWQDPVAPLFGGQCCNDSYHHEACGSLKIRAKSSHSNPLLFADDVWPGSVYIADFIADHSDEYCSGKSVLELGAGTALPSLVCAKLGCDRLVISDFPDEDILHNISELLHDNAIDCELQRVFVKGHKWGDSVDELLQLGASETVNSELHGKFDTIILAELLWKDTYTLHRPLLQSVTDCLCTTRGQALVGFAHRPVPGVHSSDQDMEFFVMAEQEFGLSYSLVGSRDLADPFAGDNGEVAVHLYVLQLKDSISE